MNDLFEEERERDIFGEREGEKEREKERGRERDGERRQKGRKKQCRLNQQN